MDFIRYAEASASLLNAPLADRDELVDHLSNRQWLQDQCTDKDASQLRRFQRDLRPVFEASDIGDTRTVIDSLNELMVQHPITPMVSDHDGKNLHLHVATKAASANSAVHAISRAIVNCFGCSGTGPDLVGLGLIGLGSNGPGFVELASMRPL